MDAGGRGQLDDGVLGEILDAAADVTAPLVLHGAGGHVHGHEGQLVEPAGDAPGLVHIAHRLAGAHGDAQDVVVLQAHGPGQGGNVAVVDHGVGDVPKGVGDGADVDILYLGVEQVLGHLEEEGGVHGAVLDVDTGGTDAHRVHPGHMLGGGLHGGDDAVIVVIRVGIHLGEPDHLLGVDRLPVHHGGDLPVAAAGVEADAAAVHVAADGLGVVLGLRDLVAEHHLEGVLKDVAHVVEVEVLAAGEAEVLLEILAGGLAPRHVDLVAALHPKDGLDQAVEIVPVGLGHLRGVVDEGVADGHLAAGPLHGDVHRLFGGGQEGPVELEDGQKIRVQRGKVFYRYLDASSFHVSLPPALFLS